MAAADANFFAQFDSASSQLSRSIALCAAAPSTAGCAPINANPAAARALMTSANSFASGLAQVYGGRNGSLGYLFVPIAGTAAQTAIEAKVAAYKAMYASYGANAITGTGPTAAQAPLTATDMQTVLTDSLFGINGKPLATSVMRGPGNIEVGMKVNLYDSFHGNDSARFTPKGFNWRQSIGGIYRLGVQDQPDPGDFTAIAAGDHQRERRGAFVHRPAVRPALLDLAGRQLHLADGGPARPAHSGVAHAGHPRVVPSGDGAAKARRRVRVPDELRAGS